MMQQMRENTKWIMLITAAAFVALMVFEWGMDMSGQSAGAFTGGELGEVNGASISYNEYNQVYQNLYQQRQEEGGSIGAAENRELQDQAFEQVVMDRLITQELARRGIRVSDEEVRAAARYSPPPELRQNPIFLTDGQFDLDKYHQFLASASADPQLLRDLESYYRRMIPRNKLFQQVAAGVVVSDDELWQAYREANETATVRFVPLNPRQLVSDDEVTVSDGDVTTYYNRNRGDFERPARARVRVVSIDKRPTPADTAAARDEARALLEEIRAGADFADMAAQWSEDDGTAQEGGSLGTIERGQMVPAFEEAVWQAPVGQVTGPVRTQFGFHLIRVDERTEETAEAAHILLPIERTLESEDSMLARVDSLETLVGRMSLEASAEELGLRVRDAELTPLLPNMPGVGPVEEGTDWVFDEGPVIGEVSPILENPRSFYVFELVEREEARPLTLDEARDQIETILRNEGKRERTRETGQELVSRIESGAALEEAAGALGLPIREAGPFTRLDFVPGIGAGNAAIGAAFGLDVGQVSDLIETRDGFFVLEVTDRTTVDREAWQAQLDQQRAQVMSNLQNRRINQFLDALREQARVEDRRDEVLQPVF